MEKYNLDEGNDAIKRVLLLMKYDMNKTLNENKEEIEEGLPVLYNPAFAASQMAAAEAGAGLAAAEAGAAGVSAAGSTGMIAAIAASPITWIALPVIAGLGIWLYTKDSDAAKVKKLFNMCSDPNSKNWKRYMSSTEVRSSSDRLYDSMEGAGTDEDAIYAEFKKYKSPADFCAVRWKYYQDYNEPLFEALDGDLDYGWTPIFRTLRNMVEDYGKKEIKTYCKTNTKECTKRWCAKYPKKCKKKKTGGGGGGKPSKWKHCTDNYTKGCTSGVIGKVQGCLGIKVDDKFGQETEGAVQKKIGKTTFTNADVDKLCEKGTIGGGGVSPDEEIVTPDEVTKDKGL